MKPGRELDAIVAEKVMGWTHLRRAESGYTNAIRIYGIRPGSTPSFLGDLVEESVPDYSTDIAAAWEVVAKTGTLTWHLWKTLDDKYHAQFGRDKDEFHFKHSAEADTAPLAICLAALKAKGVEL